MANKISDETIEYVGILAKLELSGQEKEDAKADMEKNVRLYRYFKMNWIRMESSQCHMYFR